MADKRDKTDSAGNAADHLEQEARSLVKEYLYGPDETELDTEKLASLLQQLPESRCLYERGVLAESTDKTEESLRYYQQALPYADTSKKAVIYCDIAFCHAAAHDSEKAIEFYKQALQVDPCCGRASEKLGNIYTERDDWDTAVRYYRQAIPHVDADAQTDLYCAIASCHAAADDSEKAIEFYKKALQADDCCAEAAQELGKLHSGRDDWEKACSYYEKALRHADDDEALEVLVALGDSYSALGKADEATDCFTKVLKKDKHSSEALLIFAKRSDNSVIERVRYV